MCTLRDNNESGNCCRKLISATKACLPKIEEDKLNQHIARGELLLYDVRLLLKIASNIHAFIIRYIIYHVVIYAKIITKLLRYYFCILL